MHIYNCLERVIIIIFIFYSAGAQRVSLAVQLDNMQSQISQLRSDVDTLIAQVHELRGGAGLVTTATPPVECNYFLNKFRYI